MSVPLDISSRRRLAIILAAAWLISLALSIATAVAHWSDLTSVERNRVLLMHVSWLALPAVGILIARGYLSDPSRSRAARHRARR